MSPIKNKDQPRLLSMSKTVPEIYKCLKIIEHGYHVFFAVDFAELFNLLFPGVYIVTTFLRQAPPPPPVTRFADDRVALGHLFSGFSKDCGGLILLPPYIKEMQDHLQSAVLDLFQLQRLEEKDLELATNQLREKVAPLVEASGRNVPLVEVRKLLREVHGAYAGLFNTLALACGEPRKSWNLARRFFEDRTLLTLRTAIEEFGLDIDWDKVGNNVLSKFHKWFFEIDKRRGGKKSFSNLIDGQAMQFVVELNRYLLPQKSVIILITESDPMHRVYNRFQDAFRLPMEGFGVKKDAVLQRPSQMYLRTCWNLRHIYDYLILWADNREERLERAGKAALTLDDMQRNVSKFRQIKKKGAREEELEELTAVMMDALQELEDSIGDFQRAVLLQKLDSFMDLQLSRLVLGYMGDPVQDLLKDLRDYLDKVNKAIRRETARGELSFREMLGDVFRAVSDVRAIAELSSWSPDRPITSEGGDINLWRLGPLVCRVKLEKKYWETAVNTVRNLKSGKRLSEQIKTLTSKIETMPSVESRLVMAYVYLQTGRAASAAKQEIEKGLEEVGDEKNIMKAELLWCGAMVDRELRKFQSARKQCNEALKLMPYEPKYIRELGLIHWEGATRKASGCSLVRALQVSEEGLERILASEHEGEPCEVAWLANAVAYYSARFPSLRDQAKTSKAWKTVIELFPSPEVWPARWLHTHGMLIHNEALDTSDPELRLEKLAQAKNMHEQAIKSLQSVNDISHLDEVTGDLEAVLHDIKQAKSDKSSRS